MIIYTLRATAHLVGHQPITAIIDHASLDTILSTSNLHDVVAAFVGGGPNFSRYSLNTLNVKGCEQNVIADFLSRPPVQPQLTVAALTRSQAAGQTPADDASGGAVGQPTTGTTKAVSTLLVPAILAVIRNDYPNDRFFARMITGLAEDNDKPSGDLRILLPKYAFHDGLLWYRTPAGMRLALP